MQFLGQVRQPQASDLLLLFMCQNEPGVCSEWDPNAGGNAVVVVQAEDLGLVAAPDGKEVVRQTRYSAKVSVFESETYDEARSEWASASGVSPREVLGQIGGEPSWIQGEEVPVCDECKQTMQFVTQLEEGPDSRTEMNFGGGGCAYVFRCVCSGRKAKMLWQS